MAFTHYFDGSYLTLDASEERDSHLIATLEALRHAAGDEAVRLRALAHRLMSGANLAALGLA